jgi:hypothetical protein
MSDKVYTCPYCNKTIKNDDKTISSHMLYSHGGLTKVKRKKTEYTVECLECHNKVATTQNGLSLHLKRQHSLEYVEYIIKHEFGGTHPVCQCGCKNKLIWRKGKGFGKFLHGHNRRIKKVNKPAPLPALDVFDNIADESLDIQETSYSTKDTKTDTQSVKITGKTDKPKQAQAEAIKKKEKIKDSFVTQWMWNPLINDDELIKNTLEAKFLNWNIEQKNLVTKHHEISIPYSVDGETQYYRPDFLEANTCTIYDTSCSELLTDKNVLSTINEWCKENGFTFRVIDYENY